MTHPDTSSERRSFSEAHASVNIPQNPGLFRRLFAMSGPAFLVAVGYMDPGNWATDLAAGSSFNYTLLWVLLLSNLVAILLQALAFRLGIVRGLDLAQACRSDYPRWALAPLYGLCEIAIAACDLAEVIGSAIALQLLFGLPLLLGVLLTALDTFALLFLTSLGIRKIEAVTLALIFVVAVGVVIQVLLGHPDWGGVARGFLPTVPNAKALYVAIGMIGATVMPHNLYLHSSLVQTRRIGPTAADKRQAIRFNTTDSTIALNAAFFVNTGLLVMAAAIFYRSGHTDVAEIQDAYQLLTPLLGATIAPIAFAIALLASGQSSTITGTLAGQIVMEGFLNIRVPPWIRRMITRLAAIIPAVLTIVWLGDRGVGSLLILSQVVLSLQLPFAVIPLVHFVSDRKKMGDFALRPWLKVLAWLTALIILVLNVKLVIDTIDDWKEKAGANGGWVLFGAIVVGSAFGLLLAYITLKPWLEKLLRGPREPKLGVHEPAADLRGEAAPSPHRRIAMALDFSGHDVQVLQETLRLVGDQRPALALMHVVESAPARFMGADAGDRESSADAQRLENYAKNLRDAGFTVDVFVGQGKPVPELTRLIDAWSADLVVLAAHGHRGFADLFFGSTADKLRHRIKASVLVVGAR